ncbi:hypothetical protein LJC17_02665 [Acholeplasma sp. OttesenSCG-928-E16]|nr:hypothetical protein [Acholeplasma sp. OttesenSCG-928-E16]
MKKILSIIICFTFLLTLFGCNKVLANANADYYVVNAATNAETKMEAISLNDSRVKSVKGLLKQTYHLYIASVDLTEVSGATSIIHEHNGEITSFNAGLGIKIKKSGDESWVGQSIDSGKFENITSNALLVPPFNALQVAGVTNFNNISVALEAGSYYVVFAEVTGGIKALGLIGI